MKTLLFALGTLALVGCKTPTLKPVGPLAKDTPISQQGQPLPPAPPAAAPAVRPTPPTMYVAPGDVSANPQEAAKRFAAELAADSKPATNAPVTAEVSHIKGRR